ncbi:hypothetical protein ACQJBY_002978 [Aegilops geniculata]
MESEKASRPASLLGTLRTAVKKVRFLLSFSATRWIINSIAGRRSAPSATAPLRLSFGSRRPGLLDAEDDDGSPASSSTTGPSRTVSLGSGGVSRTSSAVAASEYSRSASSGATSSSSGGSSPAGDDDIDRRAEQFIANFYKHIQMERQVSLQLRYCRVDSLQERSPTRRVS